MMQIIPCECGETMMTPAKVCQACGKDRLADNYVQYHHHKQDVWVRKDLKGEHREYCLCMVCDRYKPHNRLESCERANTLFTYAVIHNMVMPVWECPEFVLAKPEDRT